MHFLKGQGSEGLSQNWQREGDEAWGRSAVIKLIGGSGLRAGWLIPAPMF